MQGQCLGSEAHFASPRPPKGKPSLAPPRAGTTRLALPWPTGPSLPSASRSSLRACLGSAAHFASPRPPKGKPSVAPPRLASPCTRSLARFRGTATRLVCFSSPRSAMLRQGKRSQAAAPSRLDS